MSPQRIFFILGIVLFVVAALLAVVAAYVFVSQDIRSVMDDLSGRTRGKNIEKLRDRGSRRSRGNVAKGEAVAVVQSMAEIAEPSAGAPQSVPTDSNSAASMPEINYDIDDGNDDIPTVVTSMDQYHLKGYAFNGESGDSRQDDSVGVADSAGDNTPFRVTKRIVLVHSDGVITAG